MQAVVQKESYEFNTFAVVRVGEIQEGTDPKDWYWTEGEHNIADWLTRGKQPGDIHMDSIWQRGPDFLKLPEPEWPITGVYSDRPTGPASPFGDQRAIKALTTLNVASNPGKTRSPP